MLKPWLRKLLGLDRKKAVQPIVVHSYNEDDYHPDGRIIKPTKPASFILSDAHLAPRHIPLGRTGVLKPRYPSTPTPIRTVRQTTVINNTVIQDDDDSLTNTIIAAEIVNDVLTPQQPVFQGFGGGDAGGAGATSSWDQPVQQDDPPVQNDPDPEPVQSDPDPEPTSCDDSSSSSCDSSSDS